MEKTACVNTPMTSEDVQHILFSGIFPVHFAVKALKKVYTFANTLFSSTSVLPRIRQAKSSSLAASSAACDLHGSRSQTINHDDLGNCNVSDRSSQAVVRYIRKS